MDCPRCQAKNPADAKFCGQCASPLALGAKAADKDVFAIIRNAVFVIAIYCYFVGWIYAYQLHQHFGIPLASVEIPVYYFFVYSYFALTKGWAIWVILVALVVIYGLAVWYPRPSLLTLILVALFPVLFYFGLYRGEEEARRIRSGHAKRIFFVFRPDANKVYSAEFKRSNRCWELRLVVHTRDRFYVLQQPPGEADLVPYGYTHDVAKADVALATIELPDTSR